MHEVSPPLAVMFELQGGLHGFSVDMWGNNFLLTFLSPERNTKNNHKASIWCTT